ARTGLTVAERLESHDQRGDRDDENQEGHTARSLARRNHADGSKRPGGARVARLPPDLAELMASRGDASRLEPIHAGDARASRPSSRRPKHSRDAAPPGRLRIWAAAGAGPPRRWRAAPEKPLEPRTPWHTQSRAARSRATSAWAVSAWPSPPHPVSRGRGRRRLRLLRGQSGSGYNRPSMDAPLAGILVADLTQNVAGPTCTQILGDMGAEVVKVERRGRGDDARAWGPPFWGEESATFMGVNRSKRSLAVDMKHDEGRAVVERLIARADVLVQSLRAGAIEELGLGWARAHEINPRLVYCSVTAFGTEGPLSERPGYDPLMQALRGIMSGNGRPGRPPARVPVSIVDMGTGMWAAIAILGALRERDRTGRGVNVTTALYETALAWGVFQMSQFLGTGEVPLPQGSGTAMICPYEAFPTRDAWVMIAAAPDAP